MREHREQRVVFVVGVRGDLQKKFPTRSVCEAPGPAPRVHSNPTLA